MSDSRRVHVVPNGKDWKVVSEGADRAAGIYPDQAEAVDRGREIAQNRSGQLFIHGRDGRIRDERSYGNDPYPPKG